jgi:hypothetical protein
MGEQEMEAQDWRWRCGALILAVLAVLCLVGLFALGERQCANPTTEKIGSVSLWDSCGTTRKREAVNDE